MKKNATKAQRLKGTQRVEHLLSYFVKLCAFVPLWPRFYNC